MKKPVMRLLHPPSKTWCPRAGKGPVFIYNVLSAVAFKLQLQKMNSCNSYGPQPNIFTIWPFKEKVCWALARAKEGVFSVTGRCNL